MSDRINPQNNNQITSIQVCVMGFFLLKVGPPWKNFLDPRLYMYPGGVMGCLVLCYGNFRCSLGMKYQLFFKSEVLFHPNIRYFKW